MPRPADRFEVVRDPLWNTIRLDHTAIRIIDTPAFQRLRQVRQLGLAHLVYPGANHTRFDHALGVYHLTRRTLGILGERGELDDIDPAECRLVPYAALLHDIGHYPFSHALEELAPEHVPEHHEALAARFLDSPRLRAVLEDIAPDASDRIARMVRGASDSPLQGLVAGSLDLDKIEYLNRDATFCGVPYGVLDVDRLIHALTLVRDPISGRVEVGVHEKGLAALESLLFAKYQMFRNVYWHHAVRAATVLYKRMVRDAVDAGLLSADELIGRSDEGLLTVLEERSRSGSGAAARRIADRLLPALRERRLPKRALEVPGELLRTAPPLPWFYSDDELVRSVEDRLATELELPEGGVYLDYPEKSRMMGLDLLLLRRDGSVQRLPEGGREGLIDLPRVADELYHTARVFRVFTAERRAVPADPLLALLRVPADDVRHRLDTAEPLLHTR